MPIFRMRRRFGGFRMAKKGFHRAMREGFTCSGNLVAAASRVCSAPKSTRYTSTYRGSGIAGDIKKIGGDMYKSVHAVRSGEKAG